jgi:hypothetical protein
MMMAFVTSFAAVSFGEPDLAVFNAIDSANMNPVGSDHFHILLDTIVRHLVSPRSTGPR